MAKQKIRLLAAVLCLALISGCGCGHSRISPADCTEPARCMDCGRAQGYPLGHDWQAADCTKPKICALCGAEKGEPGQHKWSPATEEKPRTCKVCGLTDGEPLAAPVPAWDEVYADACRTLSELLPEMEPEFQLDEGEDILFVKVAAPEGTSFRIIQNPEGIAQYWQGLGERFCTASAAAADIFREAGYDTGCIVMLMGDVNSENVLLAAENGKIKYDVMNE